MANCCTQLKNSVGNLWNSLLCRGCRLRVEIFQRRGVVTCGTHHIGRSLQQSFSQFLTVQRSIVFFSVFYSSMLTKLVWRIFTVLFVWHSQRVLAQRRCTRRRGLALSGLEKLGRLQRDRAKRGRTLYWNINGPSKSSTLERIKNSIHR